MNKKINRHKRPKNTKKKYLEIFFGILAISVFVLISYILQTNLSYFEERLDFGFLGILIYILIGIFATVFAPLSSLPLLPVAVFIWGWFLAGVFSVISWTIGSIIAFIIARKYGVKIVKKFISVEKIAYYEQFIPKKDLFISIILLRVFFPADIVSYVLGVFSKVDFKTYSLATFLGIISFAFILSYIGSFPTTYQIVSLIVGGVLFSILYYKISKRMKRTISNNIK